MPVFRRVRELREDKDLTQKEVANTLFMQLTQYRRYETGERAIPLDLAVEIAKLYNVSLDYIAEYEPSQNKMIESSLSDNEKELLVIFRKLSPVNQGRVLERAYNLMNTKSWNQK